MKRKLVFLAIIFVLAGEAGDRFLLFRTGSPGPIISSQKVVSEENVVIDVVEKVSPSVVTVGIKKTITQPRIQFFDPFGFFGDSQLGPSQSKKIEQDIASGFVISADGLIVTNKHVV